MQSYSLLSFLVFLSVWTLAVSNKQPADNVKKLAHRRNDDVPVKLLLFTRKDRDSGTLVSYNDSELIQHLDQAGFNRSLATKLIIHGFGGHFKLGWMRDMKDGLLDEGDLNVLLVDWEEGAEFPDYPRALKSIPKVAEKIQTFLEILQNNGLKLWSVHVIGFSLGAHLAGDVGRRLNGKLGRITGLDAAEPAFDDVSAEKRLDKSDAMFVDVIHTNGDDFNIFTTGAGLFDPFGHVDFYVNGGKKQPGCMDGILGALFGKRSFTDVICSHARAHQYFIESITSDCKFTAYPCESYEEFEDGKCRDCSNNGCNEMGYHADRDRGQGSLYLDTNYKSPFCI